MMTPTATVFVTDDDEAVRKSLVRLLGAAHYRIDSSSLLPSQRRMKVWGGLNGIDLPKALIERHREEQIVFITGHGNIPMCAQAMKAGAVDFLPEAFQT